MATITPAKLLAIYDKIAANRRAADAAATAAGLAALSALISGDGATIYGSGDPAYQGAKYGATQSMITAAQPDAVNMSIYKSWFESENGYFVNTGQTSLMAYLVAQNATPYSMLVAPQFADLFNLWQSASATTRSLTGLLPANVVFAPLTMFGTATVTAGPTLTITGAAFILTVTDTVGGHQGYAPSTGLVANVTTAINGTLTVTLTASGWNAAGAAVTGRTWTAALSSVAAGAAAVNFTPAVAGDRISQITAIAGAGAATAGAFNLVSVLERVV